MIGVVCMIMDPFGCWESVGKQLKLRNLLNYIMKWDGLLHDSGFPFLFPMISWQANRPWKEIRLCSSVFRTDSGSITTPNSC
ncbi:hypothetical protein CK203_075968 [Vitis vinifera]|uniref:Uncharacterized protein n=1 Tax=Vitis vinifera TaxID=29760 RepID=A0A438C1P4_VITVI|nr:hypothetical protein CK203_075968 [Vitis vinifera]